MFATLSAVKNIGPWANSADNPYHKLLMPACSHNLINALFVQLDELIRLN